MKTGHMTREGYLRVRKGLFITAIVAVLVTGCMVCVLENGRYDLRLIVSGSMDAGPQDYPISDVPVGSLVLIDRDCSLEVGDVIAFNQNVGGDDIVIVHRIVGIDDGIITHGDANPEGAVEHVGYDEVVGKVIGVNDTVGKTIWFLRTNSMSIVSMIILFSFMSYALSNIIKEIRKGD